jgi:hypothetical protein
MKPESTEDLRRRLLRDEQVQMMISMRAYEIYKMRGSEPGHDAEDWFRAENEILTFLIQEESRREAYSQGQVSSDEVDESQPGSDLSKPTPPSEEGGARPQAFEPQTTPEIASRSDQPTGQLAAERAESQSALGAWSAAEPPSAELASATPAVAPEEKKGRSRASSKSAEPRKRKSAATASTEGAEKKRAARRTAPKQSSEGESKPKTTRRKKDEV